MGFVLVISLPLILLVLLIGFGCYFLGRARGRHDIRTAPQAFGMPLPPPGAQPVFHSSPPQEKMKEEQSMA
ncbi:uncharacterized protein [Aristolochia californica]|uniref:uncharacterized protein n=1 Tax=Aristolochia californica TaxID=171875 RepID=UPI0035DD0525